MSKTRKGKPRPPFSEDWKKNIKLSHQGKPHPRVFNILCLLCGETEPSKMVVDKRNHTGYSRICRACDKKQGALRQNDLRCRRMYGISWDEIIQRHANQQGLCAVCGQPVGLPQKGKSCLDHCHKTGRARGVIHWKCNLILGMAGDDPDTLGHARNYLLKWESMGEQNEKHIGN